MMRFSVLRRPVVMLILFDLLAFGLLYFYRIPPNHQILYVGASILVLSSVTYGVIYFCRLGDEYLFLIVSMLVTIGVAMLCRLNYALGILQVGWYLASLCVFYAAYFLYRYIPLWSKMKWLYCALGVGLFLFTQVFGTVRNGSKNWIFIQGHSFQPSEIIKLIFVFYLASYFGGRQDGVVFRVKERFVVAGVTYLFMGFLILQREWGIMLLLFLLYFVFIYIYDSDKRLLAVNVLLAGAVGIVGVYRLYHIQVRIQNWLNPWEDITNKGYQITQSLFAIAAGGFFGKGLGLGDPEMIPEVYSDFIFSAICEEMGIFGGVAVILLYFIFIYRGFKIALQLPEGFDKCVALGMTALFGFQTFIIVGGVIKLIPLTGITLPFVSYGGTSLLSSFIGLGVLQGASAKRRAQDGQ